MLVPTVTGVAEINHRPSKSVTTRYYEFELTEEQAYVIAHALYMAAMDSVKYQDFLFDMYYEFMEGNSYGASE